MDGILLSRLWVRAMHEGAEVVCVDAIACLGGLWKTQLLEFLQLRQACALAQSLTCSHGANVSAPGGFQWRLGVCVVQQSPSCTHTGHNQKFLCLSACQHTTTKIKLPMLKP